MQDPAELDRLLALGAERARAGRRAEARGDEAPHRSDRPKRRKDGLRFVSEQ